MNKRIKIRTILITSLIFLITSTAPSYAGFFGDYEQETYNSYDINSSTYYPSAISYSDEGIYSEDYNSGFFRSSSEDNPLVDRPGIGGGIGQSAPIGKGLHTLLVCCLIYGILKISAKKKGRFN